MSGVFEVVGGAGQGGILVRSARDLSSKALNERLATGALVLAIELKEGRLSYEKLAGNGPSKGWVSVEFKGKDMLVERPVLNAKTTKILTLEQCIEAQQAIKSVLVKPTVQSMFSELESKSGGNDAKYNAGITPILVKEVYPPVVRQLGIPQEQLMEGFLLINNSMANYTELSILENWLELETLMRNKQKMAQAQTLLKQRKPEATETEPKVIDVNKTDVLTQEQCYAAQGFIKSIVSTVPMQAKFQEMEAKAGGNDAKYNAALTPVLAKDVYPSVVSQLGIPTDQVMEGMRLINKSFVSVVGAEVQFVKNWLELETLMRNKPQMKAAQAMLKGLEDSRPMLDAKKTEYLTREQCIEAQQVLKETLTLSQMQSRVQHWLLQANGDERKHAALVNAGVRDEVYPVVIARLGIPSDQLNEGFALINRSLQKYISGDLEIAENWLEVAKLMRKKDETELAQIAVNVFRSKADDARAGHVEQSPLMEVFDSNARRLGVVVAGRIRGGFITTGCACFTPLPGKPLICECLAPVERHEDKGPAPTEDDDEEEEEEVQEKADTGSDIILVKCDCQKLPAEISASAIQCEVPRTTTVSQFRSFYKDVIPSSALFFKTGPGRFPTALRDDELVSENIAVSEIVAPVPPDSVLTHSQAKEAQQLLLEAVSKPSIQQTFDELESEANGNPGKYRMKLKSFLIRSVYPDVLEHMGLPSDGTKGSVLLFSAIQAHCMNDLSMLETWRELEILMRNQPSVAMADGAIKQFMARQTS